MKKNHATIEEFSPQSQSLSTEINETQSIAFNFKYGFEPKKKKFLNHTLMHVIA